MSWQVITGKLNSYRGWAENTFSFPLLCLVLLLLLPTAVFILNGTIPQEFFFFILPGIAVAAIIASALFGYAGLIPALFTNIFCALVLVGGLHTGEAKSIYPALLSLLFFSTVGSVIVALLKGKDKSDRENLEWISVIDGLTEIYNHRYFQQRLSEEISRAERNRTPLALAFVDIDYFKQYNDLNGHILGDTVLKKVAAFLNRATRGHDVVCRYGGDEFVIILPDTDAAGAAQITGRLIEEFRSQKMPGEMNVDHPLSLSIGVSAYPRPGETKKELLHQADQALFLAKTTGKNNVKVYCETMRTILDTRTTDFCYHSCEDDLVRSYHSIIKAMLPDRTSAASSEFQQDIAERPHGAAQGNGGGKNGNGKEGQANRLIVGKALGLGHSGMDEERLLNCLGELKLN